MEKPNNLKRIESIDLLKRFDFPLWVIYNVWILVIILLYPLCRKFDS